MDQVSEQKGCFNRGKASASFKRGQGFKPGSRPAGRALGWSGIICRGKLPIECQGILPRQFSYSYGYFLCGYVVQQLEHISNTYGD